MTQIRIKLSNGEDSLIDELIYLNNEVEWELWVELRRELHNELHNELFEELERELKH